MGVYIKIEMPKSCYHCWALDDYGDYPRCRITEDQRGYNFPVCEKRMDSCPLVNVPSHGRLVDADRLGFAMMDAANADQALAMVDDAPTVLEAEEGE